jgi:DNA replication and repair protein RecF
MKIKNVSLKNFRSHVDLVVDLSSDTTVITGLNGSGKTTIIESIYLALQGSSFKGRDLDIVNHDKPWWRIDITTEDGDHRVITFDPSKQSGKKKFLVDGKTFYRLPQKFKYPIVLFEPDDLRLLHGSPVRRRQFLDVILSQIDINYDIALKKYERALKQRNNLLKHGIFTSEELFAWNVILSEHGSFITKKRTEFTEDINNKITNLYNKIASSSDVISATYSNSGIQDQQKFLRELEQSNDKDKVVGFTTIGPHRHDIIFNFNNSPALAVASRGEVRSIILALKLLEIEILKDTLGKDPIVLLDDVFSELDEKRQKAISYINDINQLIITDTRKHKDVFSIELG